MNVKRYTVDSLKEQLQQLGNQPASITGMGQRLYAWCELADATGLAPMKRFGAMLRRHRTGICHYAEHPITTARLEGGHVAIGPRSLHRYSGEGSHQSSLTPLVP